MNAEKYSRKDSTKSSTKGSTKSSTISDKNIRQIKVDSSSIHDPIDNDLFIPFIGTRVDNNTYTIPLDTPLRDQREADTDGGTHEFDGSAIIVKLIPQIVKDISNSPILNDFLKSHNNNHKIVVFDAITDKVYNTIRKKKNIEVFVRDYLMIDLMAHDCAPENCKILSLDDVKYITNPKFGKIHENDPLCRYYYARVGDILRVERSSINNAIDVDYRRVIEPKPIFDL
jgi:DNA-directed RNA polymerase subunit H (RpoH/RPB5)